MENVFNISSAAQYLGIKDHSLRTAIRKGKLSGTMGNVPNTKIPRRTFTKEQLDEYSANKGSVGTRADGRNKYVIYLTEIELEVAFGALQDVGLNDPANVPTRANPPKSKE